MDLARFDLKVQPLQNFLAVDSGMQVFNLKARKGGILPRTK
jgi:hypothetical protein